MAIKTGGGNGGYWRRKKVPDRPVPRTPSQGATPSPSTVKIKKTK